MNHIYYAPPLFLVIAFLFSMLGMGGSQLYIPILFWLGMDFKTEAIPLGMMLNVVNSSSAAWTYSRRHMIDWKVAVPFGAAMTIFPPIGTLANIRLPSRPLIMIFAGFTAAAAVLMLSGWKPRRGHLSGPQRLLLGLAGGALLGFFAGLIGRGGGSFVVPLLYIAGLSPKTAAATSALVVTCSGSSGFISHILTAAHPDWGVWISCAAAVFVGSRIGSHMMANKLKPHAIRLVFGTVLLFVALLLSLQTLAGAG